MKQYEHLLPEIPARGVTELDRLAFVVHEVDYACSIVPKGSFKMIPTREVRRNEAYKGGSLDIYSIGAYSHFRKVASKEKRE